MHDTTLPSSELVAATVKALTTNHFQAAVVNTRTDALQRVKDLVPAGASVMNGSSRTLEDIGFMDYLKQGQHGWRNLHADVLAEPDMAKQGELRRRAVLSDVYLGSAHAVTQEGELLIASNTGSQLPHLAFTSPLVILVVGAEKIVPNLAAAFERLKTIVIPREDERMKTAYGIGTTHSKTLILHRENPMLRRNFHVILVNEKLGF